jgi:hypothetical protein
VDRTGGASAGGVRQLHLGGRGQLQPRSLSAADAVGDHVYKTDSTELQSALKLDYACVEWALANSVPTGTGGSTAKALLCA